MAVISIKELTEERQATLDYESGNTYSRVLQVITNDYRDGQLFVILNCGVTPGSIYTNASASEQDPSSRLLNMSAKCVGESGTLWHVSLNYKPVDYEEGEEDPVDRSTKWTKTTEAIEVPMDSDRNGDPVLNSAKDPFDPPILTQKNILVKTAVKAFSSFSDSQVAAYLWKVNSATFLGFAAGAVLCRSISVDEGVEEGDQGDGSPYVFDRVTFEFAVDTSGWTKKVLDAGFRKIVNTNKRENILDDQGNPVTSPVPLDGSGQPIDTDGEVHVLEFEDIDEVDFTSLGL